VLLSFLTAVQAVVVPLVDSSGHFHAPVSAADAVPQGKNVTINGVLTYVSLPKNGKFDPTAAVVLLTDVFGLPSPDNLILADQWAAAGFATYAPDYLNGDALPTGGNVTAWAVNHGEAQTTPPLLAVISALKSRGVRKLAATGYCFGGLYATRLVQNNTIAVGTMAHPSSLSVPSDFELILAQSHTAVEINNAELTQGSRRRSRSRRMQCWVMGNIAPGILGASSTGSGMDLRFAQTRRTRYRLRPNRGRSTLRSRGSRRI